MKLRIALINPWIYDFAAVNLWSKPLGLLRVAEYLSQFDIDLSLIDCMDVFNNKNYGKGKYPKVMIDKPACIRGLPRNFGRYGISVDDFRDTLIKNSPFDMVFMTSIMSYWYPGVRKAVEVIRSVSGNIPIILGGIYATLWHGHASEKSGADFIYKGHISDNLKFVLNTFGFRIKKRNPQTPYHRLSLYKYYPFAPVLTSTGCPYKCTYCSSNLLHKGFTQRDPQKVIEEIKELYNIGVRDFVFYDDALLVNSDSHIKVILKEVMKQAPDMRFRCPNGLHARSIDDELAYLMKGSGFRTLRLGLETVDAGRQIQTGGKVSSEELVNAVDILKRRGFTRNNIGVYLMYGLPGQSFQEVKGGVEFLKSLDISIYLAEFSPIPGTECWSELISKGIISNDIDPLLTNNTVFSYLFSGYDIDELEKLKLDVKGYNNS